MSKLDIGLIGLAVMGENLAMNIASKGFSVGVYNRTAERVTRFVEGRAAGTGIRGFLRPEELVAALERPRKILLMVRAGAPVDDLLRQLTPLLDPGDIVIDGGNSRYTDTTRRVLEARQHGLLFVGAGISGGEEGALNGPSIMPGGAAEAWPAIRPILQGIAAHVDGQPCCDWIGPDGAGHYVKMVHNGIEYGDMQLIAEAYHVLRERTGLSLEELNSVFTEWNRGELESYLVEITADIFGVSEDGQPVLDLILDAAGQKGTGKWTVQAALDAGVPATLISEAVMARFLSSFVEERKQAATLLSGPDLSPSGLSIDAVRDALYASKIISYAQGFSLLQAVSAESGWNLDYGAIAMMWRGGCIIRSVFLDRIRDAYRKDPELPGLLLDGFFRTRLARAQEGWRGVVADAVRSGIPVPAFSSALAYYDGYRSDRLPASLIQAQRDYFGAHTYERVDRPRGMFFHTDWTGHGGGTTSRSYNA